MNITRELLEHYLRATGWTIGERGWWIRGAFEVGTFEGMTSAQIATQVDRVASAERIFASSLAFRLGLCAATETCLARLRLLEVTPRGRSPVNDAHCDEARATAEVLLRAAGIEPDAWEKARRS